MNLEAIALRRAEEQMQAETWRESDAGEFKASKQAMCVVCHAEFTRGHYQRAALMCPACREAGYCTVPCKGCGGKLRDLDRRATNKSRRGYCQACRVDMPRVNRGAEFIAHAREVQAARREGRAA